MTLVNAQCRLAARPTGLPKASDWDYVEEPAPEPGEGEFRVQVEYLSLDPAMRAWMNPGRSYVPPVEIGEVMRAAGIGRVIDSRHPDFAEGDELYGVWGVQRYAVSDGSGVHARGHVARAGAGPPRRPGHQRADRVLRAARRRPARARPDRGRVRRGRVGRDRSSGQIARIKGCRAIGIAGGAEKCRWLVDELGFDAAIDYKGDDVRAQAQGARARRRRRVLRQRRRRDPRARCSRAWPAARGWCSAARSRSTTRPRRRPGPRNYMQLLVTRSSMIGFVIFDYAARYPEGIAALAGWLKQRRAALARGRRRGRRRGLPRDAARGSSAGENTGKLVLALEGAR